MPSFKSIIQKLANKGEKTGWTYIDIPNDIILKLKLKNKTGFRIKGVIDDVKITRLSTYPIGGGDYIIAINGELRKKLGKKEGAMVSIKFELDENSPPESKELLACLKEDPIALKQFNSLLRSHQNYHHHYICSAKGAQTKTARIVNVMNAMYKKQNFGEMIRSLKKKD